MRMIRFRILPRRWADGRCSGKMQHSSVPRRKILRPLMRNLRAHGARDPRRPKLTVRWSWTSRRRAVSTSAVRRYSGRRKFVPRRRSPLAARRSSQRGRGFGSPGYVDCREVDARLADPWADWLRGELGWPGLSRRPARYRVPARPRTLTVTERLRHVRIDLQIVDARPGRCRKLAIARRSRSSWSACGLLTLWELMPTVSPSSRLSTRMVSRCLPGPRQSPRS